MAGHFMFQYNAIYLHGVFQKSTELADEINDKITDIAEYAKRQSWWKRMVGKGSDSVAAKYPVATQLAIGGLSGW